MLIAVLARYRALFQPMRYDEAVAWAWYVGRSWGTIVSRYPQPNNHVLYSLLAKVTGAPANHAPWALRLPALIAGVAIVPLIWAVGRRYADKFSALLAAALCVGSTPLVLYSTNARGYTLVVAVFLAMLLVADDVRVRPTTGRWASLVLLAALGLYAIPVMLYPMGVVLLWLALANGSFRTHAGERFLLWLAAVTVIILALAALLYIPILLHDGPRALIGNKFVSSSKWVVFQRELWRSAGPTIVSWTSPLPPWSAWIVVPLALYGVRRSRSRVLPSLAMATAIWCALLLVATHRAPFVRVWIFLVPLFLLAVARGVRRALRSVTKRELLQTEWPAVALAALMAWAQIRTQTAERADETGPFRSAAEVTATLAPLVGSGDRVIAPVPSVGPLLYYFPRAGLDTSLLSAPLDSAHRAFLVLDTRHGQSMKWAVRMKIIDSAEVNAARKLARYRDGELWQLSRR